MLTPIVSMREMAMNESVASSCDYREVVTPSGYYRETVSGGYVGTGYTQKTSWKVDGLKSAIDGSSWMDVKMDFSPSWVIGRATNGYFPGKNNNGDWYLESRVLDSGHPQYLRDCSHGNDSCAYYTVKSSLEGNQHFESTKPHGDSNWQAPHDAQLFTS